MTVANYHYDKNRTAQQVCLCGPPGRECSEWGVTASPGSERKTGRGEVNDVSRWFQRKATESSQEWLARLQAIDRTTLTQREDEYLLAFGDIAKATIRLSQLDAKSSPVPKRRKLKGDAN